MMIDHHTTANAQLAQSAQAMGVTLPTDIAPNHRAVMAGLQNLSGAEFDMAYVKQQIGDHAATRDMYEMSGKNAKDKGLKDYTKKATPIVEQHYEQLRTMDMRMAPVATTGRTVQ